MSDVPADEVVYDDFTDDTFSELCMLKFKSTVLRIPFWKQAHKDHFGDAEWEYEPTAQTDLMKVQVDGKTLTMKFCHTTGIVTAQGAFMGKWRSYHLPDILKVVDNLEEAHRTGAPQEEDSLSFEESTLNAKEATALRSRERIRVSANRDSMVWNLRNQSNEELGPVDWPHSTQPMSSIPVLSQSLFSPQSRSSTQVNRTAPLLTPEGPLVTSTPIGVRHLPNVSLLPDEADYTIQERSLNEQQEASTSNTFNTLERNITQDTASSPDASSATSVRSEGDILTKERNLTQALDDFSKVIGKKMEFITNLILEYGEARIKSDTTQAEQLENITALLKLMPPTTDTPAPVAENHRSATHQEPTEEHLPNLLIGSSLVKLVDESQLKNTKVLCKRGAHPSRMTRIFKAKARAGERYQSVTLLVGGNRLKRDDPASNVIATAEEVMTAVEHAMAISDKVRVVELPPRLTSDPMTGAIVDLNTEVEKRCVKAGVDFVQTRGSFWLMNGCPNSGLIDKKDKIHLTDVGTEALLECMNIPLVNPADPRKGVRPEPPRPRPAEAAKKKQVPPPLPPKDPNPKPTEKKKHRKPNHNRPRKQQVGHATHPTQFAQPMGGQTRFYQHASSNSNGRPNTQERNQWQNVKEGGWKSARRYTRTARAASSGAPTQGRSHMQARGNPREYHGGHARPNLQQSHPPTRQTRGRSTMQNIFTQERNPQCQLCANFGHSAVSCRSRSQSCYTCGQIGHFSRACPQ